MAASGGEQSPRQCGRHTPVDTPAAIEAEEKDGSIVIEVRDTGPGVPPDRLPRIFDRFYRAGPPSGRPGAGLGLAIVAEVTAAHGGRVGAALEPPHGLRGHPDPSRRPRLSQGDQDQLGIK